MATRARPCRYNAARADCFDGSLDERGLRPLHRDDATQISLEQRGDRRSDEAVLIFDRVVRPDAWVTDAVAPGNPIDSRTSNDEHAAGGIEVAAIKRQEAC